MMMAVAIFNINVSKKQNTKKIIATPTKAEIILCLICHIPPKPPAALAIFGYGSVKVGRRKIRQSISININSE
jgi:hypothetical protein